MLAYLSTFYKPFINLEIISIKQIFIFIGRFKFTLIKKLFRLPQKKNLVGSVVLKVVYWIQTNKMSQIYV